MKTWLAAAGVSVLLGAAPASAAVTSGTSGTSVSGGDNTYACSQSGSSTSPTAMISSNCLLNGTQVASADVSLSSFSAGTLNANTYPYDPGLDQAYDSTSQATYNFAIDTTSTFTFSGLSTFYDFANIHGGDTFYFPLSGFLTTSSGSIISFTTPDMGLSGSYLLAPGSYNVELDGLADGTDVDQGMGFGYVHATTSSETLSFAIAPQAAAVPEPGVWAMMAGGMGLIGFALRRRRQEDVVIGAMAA